MAIMPRRHVSNDLKVRIPYLVYVEDFKVTFKEVGYLLGVKKSMIYQTLKEWCDPKAHHIYCSLSRRD